MFGPEIRGEKVVLRPPRPEDAISYAAWFADPEVTRLVTAQGIPYDRLLAWVRSVEKDKETVLWSLETPSDPAALIGLTDINSIDWTSLRGMTSTIIGEKNFWRQGIAAEVARLRTDFAFRVLGLNKLRTEVFVGNEGSYRAVLAAGYQVVGRYQQELFRNGQWHDKWILEVLRADWEWFPR